MYPTAFQQHNPLLSMMLHYSILVAVNHPDNFFHNIPLAISKLSRVGEQQTKTNIVYRSLLPDKQDVISN